MTDFLPLFPLQLVIYPGERLNLHIFEPRYKQLIRECSTNKITFGIPPYFDKKVHGYATEMKLLNIEKIHDNGEMDIKTQGLGLVAINQYYSEAPNKLYGGADITRIENNYEGSEELAEELIKKLKLLFGILKVDKRLPRKAEHFKTYDWAHFVGFNIQQEYDILRLETEEKRQEYMLMHLSKMLPIARQMENLKKKAGLNGHFKNIIPPAV